jgi:hypothetical protein
MARSIPSHFPKIAPSRSVVEVDRDGATSGAIEAAASIKTKCDCDSGSLRARPRKARHDREKFQSAHRELARRSSCQGSICEASISWLAQSIRTFAMNLHHVRFGHAEGSGQRFGWRPDVCRPDNVARRVSSANRNSNGGSAPLYRGCHTLLCWKAIDVGLTPCWGFVCRIRRCQMKSGNFWTIMCATGTRATGSP